ncbi:MAG: hypothetical protein M3Q97_03965 [Bacteroidota bacterium]|nr:hypothetical protein [Bacteroidota bacterium]
MNHAFSFVFALACFLFTACSDYGLKVESNGHTLYYLEPVTQQEAQNTLDYLHTINHNFSEPPLPFQLSKEDVRYVFKYPVQNKDQIEGGNLTYITNFGRHLSSEVFNGAPVDVHLMDETLDKTYKVVAYSKPGEE